MHGGGSGFAALHEFTELGAAYRNHSDFSSGEDPLGEDQDDDDDELDGYAPSDPSGYLISWAASK